MPSRKVLKIVATVLLAVGNLFMLGFLGLVVVITLLVTGVAILLINRGAVFRSPTLAGAMLGSTAVPYYLAVVSYKVAAVFGLMQICLPKDKHHWIGFVKTIAQSVFLLSAGGSIWITAAILAIPSNISSTNTDLIILFWVQIISILIAIGFHLASKLVWKCSIVPSPDEQTADQQASTTEEAHALELKMMN